MSGLEHYKMYTYHDDTEKANNNLELVQQLSQSHNFNVIKPHILKSTLHRQISSI